jgi:SAM-dependent methyltransferase
MQAYLSDLTPQGLAVSPPLPSRRSHQGVAWVVRFNWPHYLGVALLALGWIAAEACFPFADVLHALLRVAVGLGLYWTFASLLASFWVYDQSGLYRWNWLDDFLPSPPERWVNLHAGFDETSTMLRTRYPHSASQVWSFYNPVVMTKKSIHRAHGLKLQAAKHTAVHYASLPSPDCMWDCAFVIFSAHELRSPEAREQFFAEISRILKRGGRLVLVEHLRDVANGMAYGPGILHFFSRGEWRRVASSAGFDIEQERHMTPFVRIFSFRRPK